MTRYANNQPLSGGRPWPTGASAEAPCGPPAPTQQAAYTCERGCTFTLTLAGEGEPPPAWHCRCGKTALLDTAPPGASTEVRLPGYGTPGGHKTSVIIPHWQHVQERRTHEQLEELLAERLAEVRGNRGVWG